MSLINEGRASQKEDWGCASADHARQELGEGIGNGHDAGQAADGCHVQLERRILDHGRRRECQAVAGEVVRTISARMAAVRA